MKAQQAWDASGTRQAIRYVIPEGCIHIFRSQYVDCKYHAMIHVIHDYHMIAHADSLDDIAARVMALYPELRLSGWIYTACQPGSLTYRRLPSSLVIRR